MSPGKYWLREGGREGRREGIWTVGTGEER